MKHADRGSYLDYPALAGSALPKLVREQQRLDSKIGWRERELEPLLAKEKALRQDIDGLLVDAGLGHMQDVTCNGLVVTHQERRGHSAIDGDVLLVALTIAGVPEHTARRAIAVATRQSPPVRFATIKPAKGALVKKAA